jgi:hypothetical protein
MGAVRNERRKTRKKRLLKIRLSVVSLRLHCQMPIPELLTEIHADPPDHPDVLIKEP